MSKDELGLQKMTALNVSDRFDEAVRTLKRLPKVKVQSYFNAWPDVVHSTAELDQAEKRLPQLGPPSSEAINRMEECFDWIMWLEDETERRIIWLRAENVGWKQICWRVGHGRTKAWEIYTMALLKIATRWNVRRMIGR